MRVIIAEKPSVAREYAKVLKVNGRKEGYFEREGLAITWAFGHLVELAEPQSYGFGKWRLEDLPIIPDAFKLQVNGNAGAKKQFQIIKDLFKKATEIIVGTDAGREGELIFRYIYQMTGCKASFQRLWISSQTDKAILDGFKNLKPGSHYDNLAAAARSRSEADWLVGINATRALTLSARSSTVLSLGRVQTPVLCMICERYLENKNFVPEPFWDLYILLEKDNKQFKAKYIDSFKDESKALETAKTISSEATCLTSETKKVNDNPPLLFDLTSLQQETNKRFSLSAQETLNVAQSLYEKHKLITYPRTGSRYLSEDIYSTIPSLFDVVGRKSRFTTAAQNLSNKGIISKRPFNDKKVTDHHAILPTETDPTQLKLSVEEERVYDLIVTRFLAAFAEPCVKEVTKLEFDSSSLKFKASGTVVLFEGWRSIEKENKKKTNDDDDDQELPKVNKGDILPILEHGIKKKMTRAKPILSEASLLNLMETAGKAIDDDELKEAIKDTGIGTPATRASTIETLFSRDYISRDKKKLIPTELGLEIYHLIKDRSIGSVELTGKWEKALNQISDGTKKYDQFNQAIHKYTKKIVENLVELGASIQKENPDRKPMSEIGPYEEEPIKAGVGKYGTFLLHKETFYNVKEKQPEEVSLEEAISIIESKRKYELEKEKSIVAKVGKNYIIRDGQYGLYVSDGKTNASLPKDVTADQAKEWTAEQCKACIASYKKWKKSKQK